MIGATFGVGVTVRQAYGEGQEPEKYFGQFLFFFLVLFATTGIANGSTFKQIAQVCLPGCRLMPEGRWLVAHGSPQAPRVPLHVSIHYAIWYLIGLAH